MAKQKTEKALKAIEKDVKKALHTCWTLSTIVASWLHNPENCFFVRRPN